MCFVLHDCVNILWQVYLEICRMCYWLRGCKFGVLGYIKV